MKADPLEFSREITTQSINEGGLSLSIEATPEERAHLAKRFGLVSLERFSAEITLTPEEGCPWIRLKGTFSALITQNCVVTLEPLENKIDGTIARVFDTTLKDGENLEEDIEIEGEDPPDPAGEGIIDVGEVIAEQFSLEIDPFPRKPGVPRSDYTTGPQGERATPQGNSGKPGKSGPFAALEKIKKKLK